MIVFSDTLDLLWKLKGLDQTVATGLKAIADTDKAVAEGKSRVDEAVGKLKEAKDATAALRKQHKEVEAELAKLDARIKQLEQKGGAAGITAADKQRVHVDEFEMQGLELLDQIPLSEASEAKAQEELTRQRALLDESTDRAVKTAAEKQPEIDGAIAKRTAALSGISTPVLEAYETVQANHPGGALCYIDNDTCSECSGTLSISYISQVKARAELHHCPDCYRIHDYRA